MRYGGNTSCVEVRGPGETLFVLDAGTGIRRLGIALAAERPKRVNLLLTHMHLDHVEGLGFFGALFDPECSISVWGPRPDELSLEERISSYVSPPLFPVPFENVPARVRFQEVWEDSWEVDGLRVSCAPVRHPGRTVGFRLEEAGASFTYLPDNEPALEAGSGLSLARGTDVLLHDAQYTAAEYETRVGWGHSAIPDFAAFVTEAKPGRVFMFHHDPTHADDTLDEMLEEARRACGRDDVELAHEGLELTPG